MLMCFKLWFWPAAHPLSRADYHGPGSGLDIGLVPQLVWQACLSSHLESHQLTAHHHHTQHYAAGSLPGKRRVLLITCQTIDTSAQTGRREVQAQMLGESYRRPDQILRKDNRAHDYRLCEHAPHISLIRKFNNSLSPSSSDLRAKHSAQTLAGLVTANCVSDPASQSFFSNL